ncbi:MAG: sulfatase-like hydrolase/transferase [Thermoanaerobaculia bacterium]|nr:sulfatase-like hydrolase/transferase [Thermoanaerobaculia bacterium]
MKTSRILGDAARFLAAAVPLALHVGLVRSWIRFQAGTLPNQYLVQSSLVNMALCLIFIGITVVLMALVTALWPSTRGRRTLGFCAFSFAFFLFWGFNTSIGFRVLRELIAGTSQPVVSEMLLWLPGMAAFVAVGMFSSPASGKKTMNRSGLIGLIGIALLGAMHLYSLRTDPSAASVLSISPSAERKPHVFIVLVDTLRADHLGVYGYSKPTSPTVDALATDSTVFERAFAPAPWTRPSCGALLTSRHPPEIGLEGMFNSLPSEIPILPQFLSNEGYRTAGVVSSVHLSAQFGFDKGWDLLDIGTTYLQWTGTKMAYSRLGMVDWGEAYPRYDAKELTDRAIDWLDDALGTGPEPVFMYLHYSDPHAPYRPPTQFDRWTEFAEPEIVAAVDEPPFSPTWDGRTLSEVEVAAMVARYDAEIAYFDQEFRRFLDHLRALGIYRRSLIVLTSDHGEEFGEHGGWAHGHTLYNELLHIPLVVKYPDSLDQPRGNRIISTAGLVDVVPTIRDVLAASWPEGLFRGQSFLHHGKDAQELFAFSKTVRPEFELRSVVSGEHKLIQRIGRSSDDLEEELYFSLLENFDEVRGDETQRTPDPDRLEKLRTIVRSIDSLTATHSEEISLDDETLRELKALGYID